MPYNESSVPGLQEHLRSLAECPVDWSFISTPGMRVVLHDEWEDVADEFALRENASRTGGYFGIYGVSIETETDVETLVADIASIERWIEAAREEYKTLTRPLTLMHVATQGEYHKHFPRPKDTMDVIRKRSKKDSCFFKGVTRELLTDYMWELFEHRWEEIRFQDHLRVYTNAFTVIGASGGDDTEIICWDVSYPASIAHAYPITLDEVRRNHGTAYPVSDRLRGVVQKED